jgi:thiol peroxidase
MKKQLLIAAVAATMTSVAMADISISGSANIKMAGKALSTDVAAAQSSSQNMDIDITGSNGATKVFAHLDIDNAATAGGDETSTDGGTINVDAAALEGVTVTTVSMDLPFAAAKFCSTAGIENLKVCSDFRNKDFSNAYGMLLADGPLAGVTARAIFVIARDGKVSYKELVSEITAEPDYSAAIEAAKAAL